MRTTQLCNYISVTTGIYSELVIAFFIHPLSIFIQQKINYVITLSEFPLSEFSLDGELK
jgi:hypothetical protein